MRRTHIPLVLLAVAAGLIAAAPRRQSPNVSGHWTLESDDRITDDASRTRIAHAPDGFCGEGCLITQDTKALNVVRDTLPASPTLTFKLDGSDSSNGFPTPDGAISMTSHARLDANTIAIDTDPTRGALQTNQRITVSTRDGKLEVAWHSGGRRSSAEVIHKQIFKRR